MRRNHIFDTHRIQKTIPCQANTYVFEGVTTRFLTVGFGEIPIPKCKVYEIYVFTFGGVVGVY